MAATTFNSFDTQHDDMIHDAQLDYYGKRLATCSSDRTIRIFDVSNGTQQQLDMLKGHEGPVWQVAWAHPKFGSILASCSYDSAVFIWKETNGVWSKLKELNVHSASVNSVAWAPHEYGLVLACASSDGKVSVSKYQEDGTWQSESFHAHAIGANAVSWAPSAVPGSLVSTAGNTPAFAPMRLVSGGCDNLVKIWEERDGQWKEQDVLQGHNDWVRDVAWAPNIGLPTSYIASCSQDKTAVVWTQDANGGAWIKKTLSKEAFPDVVWRVSWSVSGNILAVSCGDNKVTLWKENLEGQFQQLAEVHDQ